MVLVDEPGPDGVGGEVGTAHREVAIGIAVGALLLEDLTGSATLAGFGLSTSVVVGALLAIPIVHVTNAHGRRYGLTFAYLVGVLGATGIVAALYLEWAPLAFAGMFCFGGGTAANLQARYAAVDLAEPARRGRQLSIIVWATTLGAVAGPSLSPLADDRPAVQGLSDLVMGCAGATAGIASGFVVELSGYPMLTLLAACTVIPVTVAMLRTRWTGSSSPR